MKTRLALVHLLNKIRRFYYRVEAMYPDPSRRFVLDNLKKIMREVEEIIEIAEAENK